jgi:hypothetical protein
VTDQTLRLTFHSPGTESYRRVVFSETRSLSIQQLDELRRVISDARLVQIKPAIPRPRFSGHTREVVIVRSGGLSVAGGRFNSNVHSSDQTPQDIERQIVRERSETSTIGGRLDAVIQAVRKLFPELEDLISKMWAGDPACNTPANKRLQPTAQTLRSMTRRG